MLKSFKVLFLFRKNKEKHGCASSMRSLAAHRISLDHACAKHKILCFFWDGLTLSQQQACAFKIFDFNSMHARGTPYIVPLCSEGATGTMITQRVIILCFFWDRLVSPNNKHACCWDGVSPSQKKHKILCFAQACKGC